MVHTENAAWFEGEKLGRLRSFALALAFALAFGLTAGIAGVGQAHAQEGSGSSYAAGSLAAQATKDIDDLGISVKDRYPTYTGFEIKPSVEITDYYEDKTLVEGTDYTLSYANNTNKGIATITITFKGSYSGYGSKTETFEISEAYMSNVVASELPSFTYSGNAYTPKPTLTLGAYTLKEGVDYLLTYEYNTDAGKAYVTATGIGNFYGSKTPEFTIYPAQISAATLSIADQYYDGYAKTPGLSAATFNGKTLSVYTD